VNKPLLFSTLLHLTVGLIVIFGLPSLARKHDASAPIAVEFISGMGLLENKTDQKDPIKSLIEETAATETSEVPEKELSVEEKLPPLPAPKVAEPEPVIEPEPKPDLSEIKVEPEEDTKMAFDPDAEIPKDDQVTGAADAAKQSKKSDPTDTEVKQKAETEEKQQVLTTTEGTGDFIAKLLEEDTKTEEQEPKSEKEVKSKSTGEGDVADVNPTDTKKEEKPVATPIPKPKPREIAKLKKPKPLPVKPKEKAKAEPKADPKEAAPKKSQALDSIISSVLSKDQQLETASTKTTAPVEAPEDQSAGQSGGVALESNEIARVIRKIEGSWITPPGLNGNRAPTIRIRLVLDLDGNVLVADVLDPRQDQTFQVAAESMLRAVRLASPLPFPAEKYDSWQTTILKFNLQELISG